MKRAASILFVLLCLWGMAWAQTMPPGDAPQGTDAAPAATPGDAQPPAAPDQPVPLPGQAAPEAAPVAPPAPPAAIAAVEAHFAAILAEDYTAADKWFSAAFLHAFKPDVQQLNQYYLMRLDQLKRGYTVVGSRALPDPGRETAEVVVDFADEFPEAPVRVTERMHYYLIREKAIGAPGEESDGWAWRIDIFDALGYDSLADARRRHYLYTKEAWREDASRELKSRQGLFRIQYALEQYASHNGQYPERLRGGDDRRDALLGAGLLTGAYPPAGYDNRAMLPVEFDERSSGDFSYYAADAEGDGYRESYWLLLHGKDPQRGYFTGRDTVYILAPYSGKSQLELAQDFAAFWQARTGKPLEVTGAAESLAPLTSAASEAEPVGEAQGEPAAPAASEQPGTEASVLPAEAAQPPAEAAPAQGAEQAPAPDAVAARERLAEIAAAVFASMFLPELEAAPEATPGAAPATPPQPAPGEELTVRSFGF
jgi:hypothetical protein